MRVFLDDQPVIPPRPTIASALAEVRRLAEGRHRVIVEAVLDGAAVSDQTLSDPPDDECPGEELRFATEEPFDLVYRTLGQVADALAVAGHEQAHAAELIQTGRLEEAMRCLSTSLETWGQVQQAVTGSVALLGMSIDQLRVKGVSVGDSVGALALRLGELRRALATEDWSGLSDALAFDMQEQARSWKQLLDGLSETVLTAARERGAESVGPDAD